MDSVTPLAGPIYEPFTVGRAFVMQYYDILYNSPQELYRFYKEISQIGRVGPDGVMRVFSTIHAIREELKTLSSGGFKSAKVTCYDTQYSHDGGFILSVTGYFTLNEGLRKNFIQTFFLAPQENGYFVLNDILRFFIETDVIDVDDSETLSSVPAPAANNCYVQAESVSVNPVSEEVSKPLSNENASVSKENVLVPEIVKEQVPDIEITCKEVTDDSPKVSHPDTRLEDVPRKSYVSVLKVGKDKFGVSAGSLPSPLPRNQEHQVSSDPSLEQILKDQDHQASPDHSPTVKSDAVSEVIDATENVHHNEVKAVAERTSIYVKYLPTNVTFHMLETVFQQFGAISNDGIQVIYQRDLGYPYGFVEFEDAAAAQKAIEASPMMIGGKKAIVEEKRSTSRGNKGNGNGNRNGGGRGSYGYGNNNRRGGGGGGGRGGGRSFNRRGNEYVARNNNY